MLAGRSAAAKTYGPGVTDSEILLGSHTALSGPVSAWGIGSTEGMGICHAYAPDGRCISLLKILLTNSCIFDCHYCINRKSSNVRRARFTAAEVVRLTLAFYKRNYIEGLFLSSGVIRTGDYTMEEMVRVAKTLRERPQFASVHFAAVTGWGQEDDKQRALAAGGPLAIYAQYYVGASQLRLSNPAEADKAFDALSRARRSSSSQ